MKYTHFLSLPVKARKQLVSEELRNNYSYVIDQTSNKRDKQYIKALTAFQASVGLTPNGVICEATFNKLFRTENVH